MKARLTLKPFPRILAWTLAAIGLAVLAAALSSWRTTDSYRYGCFVLLASAVAGFRISLPGTSSGAISVNFLFILYGIAEFSFSETVLLAAFVTLAQYVANWTKSLPLLQVAFHCGLTVIATTAAYGAAQFPLREESPGAMAASLLAAVLVLFFTGAGPAALMMVMMQGGSLGAVWKQCFLKTLPYYLLGSSATALAVIAGPHLGWQTALLAIPILYLVYRSYCLYLTQLRDETNHTGDMAALHLRTIEALALAIEAKDSDSHHHLHRIQTFATGLAEELGLPPGEVSAVRAASLLHDIGKLAVPEHIISKRGELTAEEDERLRIHPVVGAQILSRVRFPYPVEPVVRSHHERWDGSGYPDRLTGEEIPVGARILSVAGAFDEAASSGSPDTAMDAVRQGAGTAFDPRVVMALETRYRDLEALAIQTAPPHPAARHSAQPRTQQHPSGPATGFADEGSDNEGRSSDFLRSIAAARQEVQTLFELAQDLGNTLALEETLDLLTRRLERIVPYDCIVLFLLRGKRLESSHVGGASRPQWVGTSMLIGEGLSGWVAENRKPILNGNPAVEAGFQPADPAGMRSALAVPLEGLNGLMGVFTFYSSNRDAFSRDHQRMLLAIGPKIALSVENALRFLQAENSATTDYLTGLPNARSLYLHLEAEIARSGRNSDSFAILVCDLDGFKQVNDRFGHVDGNRVLRLVAAGMMDVCHDREYVARMGGDEFVVILPGIQRADLDAKLARLQKVAFDAGLEVCGERILAVSIGVAHYPADGTTREALIHSADERMYAEKRESKKRLIEQAHTSGWKSHAPPRTTTR
jgi:diguanylate cyclase (GGDEF)-like protein/putative nucleotidyltransferase with HDIG domain